MGEMGEWVKKSKKYIGFKKVYIIVSKYGHPIHPFTQKY
jgi:hypothetical protein